jgi:uncharacterized protein
MARFKIRAHDALGTERIFHYDNETSEMFDHLWRPLDLSKLDDIEQQRFSSAPVTSPESPLGKTRGAIKTLKISLGLSCNYSCTYCSQRFVPHAAHGAVDDVHKFLQQLPTWFDGGEDRLGKGVRIEFWGGEPFVYWKKLQVLAGALRSAYPNAKFVIVTNGSLLTYQINAWLDLMGFYVGLSHDGPGQHVRGPDPLEDPAKRAVILDLYRRLRPSGRMSFNAMLNRENTSRAAIQRFFQELTGDPEVPIGEGVFVDAYDEGGKALSLRPEEEHQIRRQLFEELRAGVESFSNPYRKAREFLSSLKNHRPASALGQKCGMDRPGHIAVDLKGNVLTCQNVSAVAKAPNGASHKIGHVNDWDGIKLNTARHWSTREGCLNCPVLQLCQGSCMYLEGDLFETSCRNAYSDYVSIMAVALYLLTDTVPFRIEGPHPAERHDLWGEAAGLKQPSRLY